MPWVRSADCRPLLRQSEAGIGFASVHHGNRKRRELEEIRQDRLPLSRPRVLPEMPVVGADTAAYCRPLQPVGRASCCPAAHRRCTNRVVDPARGNRRPNLTDMPVVRPPSRTAFRRSAPRCNRVLLVHIAAIVNEMKRSTSSPDRLFMPGRKMNAVFLCIRCADLRILLMHLRRFLRETRSESLVCIRLIIISRIFFWSYWRVQHRMA